MYTPISIQHKRNFIQWFLRNYTLKRHEVKWLLNFIMKDEKLLNQLSFVHDAKFCPRAIVISSHCSDGIPFLFYKQHVITTDIEKFFHDIRLHEDEYIYVQLNFHNVRQNPYYAGVLEENPYAPIMPDLQNEDKRISNSLLTDLIREHQFKKIKEDIDQALDQKDEKKFNQLVRILKNLN